MGIVWLNPLIFQVRTLRAGELQRLVWNHPTQLGERENYTLGLRPQGSGSFHRKGLLHCLPVAPCLNSLLRRRSLISSACGVRQPPLSPTVGVDQLPLGVQGWDLSPRIVKTCFFIFGKSEAQLREGACLGDPSQENERPGSKSSGGFTARGSKAWRG